MTLRVSYEAMNEEMSFKDVEPEAESIVPTAQQISVGIPIPPVRIIQVMSPDEWESFTEEWLTFHKQKGSYQSIKRYSGPGDLGLDVIAFTNKDGFKYPWDSYQCKHYDHALQPYDIYGEIGKIIYHSFNRIPPFNQACRVPRSHVFVAPRGVGIKVGRWLKDPDRFKKDIRENWESRCVPRIGSDITAPLIGKFLNYFDGFDFSIFDDRTSTELIDEHSQTVFHAARFGGGLPTREQAPAPPVEPSEDESLYIRKLLDAYSHHLGQPVDGKNRAYWPSRFKKTL